MKKNKGKSEKEVKKSFRFWSIFWIVIMFMSLAGEYCNEGVNFEKSVVYSLIQTFIVTLIMMFIPWLISSTRENKMPYFFGVKVCLINSIAMFVLSVVLKVKFGIGIIGGLGALIFYFINKGAFVDEDKLRDTKLKNKTINDIEEYFMCSNCGCKVNDNAQKCPNCGELFEDEEEFYKCSECGAVVSSRVNACPKCNALFDDEDSDVELDKKTSKKSSDKYDELREIKKLLDEKILTKEEFDKEKKKILDQE